MTFNPRLEPETKTEPSAKKLWEVAYGRHLSNLLRLGLCKSRNAVCNKCSLYDSTQLNLTPVCANDSRDLLLARCPLRGKGQ